MDALLAQFGGLQLALAPGGTERIIHAVRHEIREKRKSGIAVDCVNAYNAINRDIIRDILAEEKWRGLHGLFNTLYASASVLFVAGGAPIISSQGVRQGDVLGPALFCLGLHPLLTSLAEAHPKVKFFAFVDDIVITGSSRWVRKAFSSLVLGLEELGLRVNKQKTFAFGEEGARLATKLGISHNPTGAKLLGAWVSTDDCDEIAYLELKLKGHDILFERLGLLPQEIALVLLSRCAHPRWNHLARTHPSMGNTTAGFDAKVQQSLAKAASVQDADHFLQSAAVDLAAIPLKDGGLGLRKWVDIAPAAYAASRDPSSATQETRSAILDQKNIEQYDNRGGSFREKRLANAANKKHICGCHLSTRTTPLMTNNLV